jgi:hypothetical protein
MISKDWAYKNIFNMSKDEIDEEKIKIVNDLKDTFRYNSIENDGNDPAMQDQQKPEDVEESLKKLKTELENKGGRPKEGNTYGKDKHPYGRDPLGAKENKSALKRESSRKSVAKEYINGVASTRKVITEKKDFLDDGNLLDV